MIESLLRQEETSAPTLTTQQIEELMRLLPQRNKAADESDEEQEHFDGNALCLKASSIFLHVRSLDNGHRSHRSYDSYL